MRARFLSVALLVLPALCFAAWPADLGAQQTRNRPSRRATNPVRRQPAATTAGAAPQTNAARPAASPEQPDVRLVSAAEDQAGEEAPAPRRNTRRSARRNVEETQPAAEAETLRNTVDSLSTQVTRLAGEVNQLKDQQRTLVNLERLTRAEQRAEGLRSQLREVVEKEANLQGRREQLEYELRPENIQRRAAMTGTLNPDALRAEIQRQLEGEQRRVQVQLDLYIASRTRLEAALVTADADVERMRARLDEDERRELEARQNNGNQQTSPRPATTTTTNAEPTNIP